MAYVTKNWLPFVLGPLLAIDTMPRAECWATSVSKSELRREPHTPSACHVSRLQTCRPICWRHPCPCLRRSQCPCLRAVASCWERTSRVSALDHEPLDVSASTPQRSARSRRTDRQHARACGTWCRRSSRWRRGPGSSQLCAAPRRRTPPPSGRPASCAASRTGAQGQRERRGELSRAHHRHPTAALLLALAGRC